MSVSGLKFALDRAHDRFLVQPARQKRWAEHTKPFIFTNDEGVRFELDPREYVDSEIFAHGYYERRFLNLLRSTLPAGLVALDIGANIGNHAVFMGRFFERVHAFDPNPSVLPRLRRNVALNGLEGKITIHPVGLGKRRGTEIFRDDTSGNLGGSGFLKPGERASNHDRISELQIVNADDYVAGLDLPAIHFIKIDVEGWEPDVFEGLKKTIAHHRPAIAFEFHAQQASQGDFERISACLPGYTFAELRFAAEHASLLDKLRWCVRNRGRPDVVVFERPEARSYENVLALADERQLLMFKGG